MLYYVPLEHLDERYTISMDNQLRSAFKQAGINYTVVEGKLLSSKIQSGAFLDFAGTNYFKSSQIQQIARLFFENKIVSGDTFFFSDLWFPGLDALPYMSRLANIKIKIAGYQYAGSWTPSDFVSLYLRDYCQFIEHGWLQFIDNMYLCSNFQRQELIANLLPTSTADHERIIHKLIVTRLPFNYHYVRQFYDPSQKLPKIVFPHRFHWEKGADSFLDMAEYVSAHVPEATFVITSGRSGTTPLADKKEIGLKYSRLKRRLKNRLIYKSSLTKRDFYKELNSATIVWSAALQENFGYSILESSTLGVTPVLPNRVVYPELYPAKYIYQNQQEGFEMVVKYLKSPEPVSQDLLMKIDGTTEMIKHLKLLIHG